MQLETNEDFIMPPTAQLPGSVMATMAIAGQFVTHFCTNHRRVEMVLAFMECQRCETTKPLSTHVLCSNCKEPML